MSSSAVNEKVSFAFELYDTEGSGTLKAPDLSFILTAMNNVASYFGDPVMSSEQVRPFQCTASTWGAIGEGDKPFLHFP